MNDVKSRLEKLVSRCRHLVGSFKHSEELRRELSKTQAHLLYTTRIQLVQDIAIRWNSTYDMLDSICVNQGALTMLNMDPKYNSKIELYVPTSDEFEFIDEFCNLLEPLKDFTVLLSAKKYVTICFLYPLIYSLLNGTLSNIELHSQDLLDIREVLLDSIRQRFDYIFKNNVFLASTFLDYNYKNFDFLRDDEKKKNAFNLAKNFLHTFYKNRILPLSNNQNAENVSPISNVNDVNIQSNSLGNSSDSGSSGDSSSDPNDNFVQTPLSTINTNSRRNVNRTRSKNNEYFSQLKDINVNSNINYTELNGLEALNKEIGQ
jgi:hypothetical protein